MPYGLPNELWAKLPPDDQAAIAATATGQPIPAIGGYTPTAATPAPPPTLTSGTSTRPTQQQAAPTQYPVATTVTTPRRAPVGQASQDGAWTLAAREAQVATVQDALAVPGARIPTQPGVSLTRAPTAASLRPPTPGPSRQEPATQTAEADLSFDTDALIQPGMRVPTRPGVTLITAPAASPLTPLPTEPAQQPHVDSETTTPTPMDTDALVMPGARAPRGYLGQNVTLVAVPKAQRTPPALASTPQADDFDTDAFVPAGVNVPPGYFGKRVAFTVLTSDDRRTPARHGPPGPAQVVKIERGPAKGVVLTSRDLRIVEQLQHITVPGVHGDVTILNPLLTLEAAKKAGLSLPVALALLSMESSGGYNWWGDDPNIFQEGHDALHGRNWGKVVTKAAYDAYREQRTEAKKQGVGPAQLTDPSQQKRADQLGGAWKPLPNMIAGFEDMRELIRRSPTLRVAIGRYNGSPPYADYANGFLQYEQRWAAALALKQNG